MEKFKIYFSEKCVLFVSVVFLPAAVGCRPPANVLVQSFVYKKEWNEDGKNGLILDYLEHVCMNVHT